MKNSKRIKYQEKESKNLKQQMLDNQSQCPICLQDYDLLRRNPMMICFNQHSTCEKCLSSVFKKSKCPICCQKLIRRADVKKNRLVCCMLEQIFRGNGQILLQSNKYTYKGEIKNGKRHGLGQQLTKDGNFIKGRFEDGELVGKCQVITKNGARFNGQAKNGRLQGIFTTKYGSIIEGSFDFQTLAGSNCTKKYTNGDVYVGMINKLKANGYGKLTFGNGNTFEGDFEQDYIRGNGSATIHGTFQVQINNGEPYIKQIQQQIRVNPSQSQEQSQYSYREQSEQSSLDRDSQDYDR